MRCSPISFLVADVTSSSLKLPRGTEIVIAGFPCIDVSIAGLKKGAFGPHTGLWVHVPRLLSEARSRGAPIPFVLMENVPGLLLSYGGGRPAISHIVESLESLG